MSKTVYVIGAGCSKNYEEGRAPKVPNLDIPTDENFLAVSAKLLMNNTDYFSRYLDLITLISAMFLTDQQRSSIISERATEAGVYMQFLRFFTSLSLSLERVITIIDSEVSMGLLDHKYIDKLADLICITLEESLFGVPCRLHQELAHRMQKGDAVISYNYDILMDNALLSSSFFNENGYVIPFHYVYEDDSFRRPCTKRSQLEILKLHGSLNWLTCGKCGTQLLFKRKKTGVLVSGLSEKTNCPNCGSDENFQKVIIPPILNKRLDMHPYKRLWERAFEVLLNADRIVLIGYRLPLTDFNSEVIFRGASRRRSTNLSLEIVNPCYLTLKNRFSDVFATDNIKGYLNLRDYLNGEEIRDDNR